jgi:SAM-dependent methyltransferase
LDELAARGGWRWDVVLVERALGSERELCQPTRSEIRSSADSAWHPGRGLAAIPAGQETAVLLRHGFGAWHDLYPARQRVVLERLLAYAPESSPDPRVVQALRLGIIGSAEMAGYLSRWDRYYLKSYEAMAGHRFNFSTLVAEPNVWGSSKMRGRGTVRRRLERMSSIAEWLHERLGRTLTVEGPFVSDEVNPSSVADVIVVEGSSETIGLGDAAADLIVTDPPYHDDVEYDELSLPLRAWAELSLARLTESATANVSLGHNTGVAEYESLLTRIFSECRRVLRPEGHLIFSYANRQPEAWVALFAALEASGLRACGVTYVHSENETDLSKRGVRACTYDLLLDLVRSGAAVEPWRPSSFPEGDEGDFLENLAAGFLQVGSLSAGWRDSLGASLRTAAFLA